MGEVKAILRRNRPGTKTAVSMPANSAFHFVFVILLRWKYL